MPSSVKHKLRRLLDIEYRSFRRSHVLLVSLAILLIGSGYVIAEVLLGAHPVSRHFSLVHFSGWLAGSEVLPRGHALLSGHFPLIWLGLAALCIAIRVTVIVSSYRLARAKLGTFSFNRYFITYLSSFIIALGSGLLVLASIGALLNGFGLQLGDGLNVFESLVERLRSVIDSRVASLFTVQSYALALVLTIFLSALPGYFGHWLCHRSRFCWLVLHKPHHCPEFLHPLATPPAFVFEFLLLIPKSILAIAISKLIYTEPLLMEVSLWYLAGYCMEIFNHSSVHYEFAYRHPVVRNLCRVIGDSGVYHVVHHSALRQDQNINLGGSPFNLWDRIFGTYRKPYRQIPPLGLTGTPPIRMNPFRIIFSGVMQIAYEWRMNTDWRSRWNILFGSVYYQPAVSRDFLKIGEARDA